MLRPSFFSITSAIPAAIIETKLLSILEIISIMISIEKFLNMVGILSKTVSENILGSHPILFSSYISTI